MRYKIKDMWSLFINAQKEATKKEHDDQSFRTGFIVQGDASRYDAPDVDESKIENVEFLPVDTAHERLAEIQTDLLAQKSQYDNHVHQLKVRSPSML